MLSKPEFIRQLFQLKDQYRNDNEWVGRWTETWNTPAVMSQFIEAAYNLYAATATNALQLTLLGGTQIRLDQQLIMSFGVTGVSGIQDDTTRRLVHDEILRRKVNVESAGVRPDSKNPDKVATPVTGCGSILSEERWTPILNDALILGAITGGQTFALALTPDEQHDWEKMNGPKVHRTAVLAAGFDDIALKNAWKGFFNAHPKMFFDSFGPRVFTRELLGLKWFGYKPEFSWHQLGFSASSGTKEIPSFENYITKLQSIHFQHPCDKVAITAELSTFFFGDVSALRIP